MSEQEKFTRRQILKTGVSLFSSFGLISPVPKVLNKDKHLVMVHLEGGNDALNTVVPYTDSGYYKLRPNLSLKPDNLYRISRAYGLNPALNHLSDLYRNGNLAIILGTGYPDQSMSHVLSTNIWNSGDLDGVSSRYWFDNQASYSGSLKTTRHTDHQEFLSYLRRSTAKPKWLLSGTRAEEQTEPVIGNPLTKLFDKQKIKSKFAFSNNLHVHHLELNGFDTHENQLIEHARALKKLDETIHGASSLFADGNYLIFVYSEFGRTITANEDGGTEHGAGGVTFLIGTDVNGGVYGDYGKLGGSPFDAVRSTVDFRSLQSTIISDYINC